MSTHIEWTDEVWNPVSGCDRVSAGCEHCYALSFAKRLKGMGVRGYDRDGDPATSGPGFGVSLHPWALELPFKWRKPRRVFVNSMSDLFHEEIPDNYIARVFAVMALAGRHTFQVLTKRHGRMRSLLNNTGFRAMVAAEGYAYNRSAYWNWSEVEWPLRNVWLGVSVENQQWANIRIPALLDTPAAVRFLSCEPLLGPIALHPDDGCGVLVPLELADVEIDWVIVGGESGPGARPMHPDWARSLRDQCTAAGVAFHFKQWGSWVAHVDRETFQTRQPDAWVNLETGDVAAEQEAVAAGGSWTGVYRAGKKAAGRELDGRTWDEFPEAVTV